MNNTIIYLIGFPGTGKYTIAKELVKRQPGLFLVDNHLINNPIFSLIARDGKTKLPKEIWNYTRRIRDVVFDAIVSFCPQENSYVLTNNLAEEDADDQKIYRQAEDLAKQKNAFFIPVRLVCDLPELQKRIVSSDRDTRMKMTDQDGVAVHYRNYTVLMPDHPYKLELDVTRLAAEDAAAAILAHVEKYKGLRQ